MWEKNLHKILIDLLLYYEIIVINAIIDIVLIGMLLLRYSLYFYIVRSVIYGSFFVDFLSTPNTSDFTTISVRVVCEDSSWGYFVVECKNWMMRKIGEVYLPNYVSVQIRVIVLKEFDRDLCFLSRFSHQNHFLLM